MQSQNPSLMGTQPAPNGISAGAPQSSMHMNGTSQGFGGVQQQQQQQQAAPQLQQQHAAGAQQQNDDNLVYPALHLHPLNNTFHPKQISLASTGPNNRVKIGRQTNAKTVPHPSNGYFDSKVLSRMHAEVWAQDGKVYIKDVKSSNGTFINGERLSAEAQESDVFELHNEDMVEFGIDIVGDDNKSIVHHKVACRVYLVITAEDAIGVRNDFATLYRGGGHGGPMGGSGVGPGAEGGLRRGNTGMKFDHILSRLQNELQKSRETGSELGNLASAMTDIHDTLGGGLPPNGPSFQHLVPQAGGQTSAQAAEASAAQNAAVTTIQTQLSETQASLAAHVDKIRGLEGVLIEHEVIKNEVELLKKQVTEAKQEIEVATRSTHVGSLFPPDHAPSQLPNGRHHGINGINDDDDFDDNASMASASTLMPGDEIGEAPPRGVDEIESAQLNAVEEHQQQRQLDGRMGIDEDEHVGPRAPPDLPPSLVARDAAEAVKLNAGASTTPGGAVDAVLADRLAALEAQLQDALNLGKNLAQQHQLATDTVRLLETRVLDLEKEVRGAQGSRSITSADSASADATHEDSLPAPVLQALDSRFEAFRTQIEDGWRKEREDWDVERDSLRRVVEAWDEANGRLEEEVQRQGPGIEGLDDDGADDAQGDDEGEHVSGAASTSANASSSNSATTTAAARKRKARRNAKRHVNPALRILLYGPGNYADVEDDRPSGSVSRGVGDAVSSAASIFTGRLGGRSRRPASNGDNDADSTETDPNEGSFLGDERSSSGASATSTAPSSLAAAGGTRSGAGPTWTKPGGGTASHTGPGPGSGSGPPGHGPGNVWEKLGYGHGSNPNIPALGATGIVIFGLVAWAVALKGEGR